MTELLDCTFRDGGYYTSWDFDEALFDSYLHTMSRLPVSMIELGYRSAPKDIYHGRFFHLDVGDLKHARGVLRNDQKLAVMLNAKDCIPADIAPLLEDCRGAVQLIRFACAPDNLAEGLALARATKALGFGVAMNLMYLTKYIDDISPLAPLADAGGLVDYVALVDSYGGCMPGDVGKAFRAATKLLPQKVGFHGHNNLSLAFSNSMAAIEAGAAFVDGTIMGMGRGAGNVQTEIMLAYLNKAEGADVNFARLATLVDQFQPLHRIYGWGPSLPYIISGFANLPQAEVMEWIGKRRYTPSSIVDALRNREVDAGDARVLPAVGECRRKENKAAMIVGGGQSIPAHLKALQRFAETFGGETIHSSLRHADELRLSGRFVCLAGQELARWSARELSRRLSDGDRVITQPPPRFIGSLPEDVKSYQTDVSGDFEGGRLGPISDVAPLQLSLAAARDLGAKTIYLAGFDGYAQANIEQQQLMADTERTIKEFCEHHPEVEIFSLLPTRYAVPVRSLYSLLM